MEVFETEKHYIFVKNGKSLWWNRTTSEFQVKCAFDFAEVFDIECIGITYGIVGEIKFPGVYDPHLLIIKEAVPIGSLCQNNLVYKIKSVCILSQDEPDCSLIPCSKHATTSSRPNSSAQSSPQTKPKIFDASSNLMNKTWGAMKSAGSTIKNTTQQAASIATTQVKSKVGIKEPYKKLEKRISEEIHKVFDDTDSFYYCPTIDITNNIQRKEAETYDDRFLWNKHMLSEMLKLEDQFWTLPIIQGFVQVEQCVIDNECFTLALVSRRSRFRAGTRYKRRGIDEDGHVANYVETEQILSLRQHQISFTQIRGSVPLYWSQPGYKYRPPPKIDKDDEETQKAFAKHFDDELKIYKNICIVNLVEQSGKEKIIGDKYAEQIIRYNNENLMYATFDFHEYCRGMRFENVSALIEALAVELHDYGFHWRDNNGAIKNQAGIFRVNCMDCLDRTNVVQTALGKAILESQLVKLGLAPPYSQLPIELKTIFMTLYANNGDTISRQYAGTNALKGDYTRTGERKISGLVKDGMNSANRYYLQHFVDSFRQSVLDLLLGNLEDLCDITADDPFEQLTNIAQTVLIPDSPAPTYFNYSSPIGSDLKFIEDSIYFASYYLARFKDTYRQATIDLLLGNQMSNESLSALGGQQIADETDAMENAEHARLLVDDCRKMLLGTSLVVGAWGLIDADPSTGDANETEVDTILLLTSSEFYVAEYDSQLDKIVKFECVPLSSVTVVEFGLFQQQQIFKSPAAAHLCIRINYTIDNIDGYFYMFRSANIRFFNNTAVVIKKNEELVESMTAIVEVFRISLESIGKDVPFICGGSLQRRKSRNMLQPPTGIPRNLSESQLVQLGSKALSNVAGQFTKLGQSFNPAKGKNNKQNANPPVVYNSTNAESKASSFYVGREAKEDDDSDDDNDCSIYEPEMVETEQNPIFNENAFLPSVGIVMSNPSHDENSPEMLQNKPNARHPSNMATISITSVTDHIHVPASMQPLSPMMSPMKTIAPEIKIDSSANLTPRNEMSLNLTGSQSENAIKQLKTLTSPLTMIAKSVQSLGMSSKSQTQLSEMIASDVNSKNLEEKFAERKCKSKLIAL
ncbi:phosphatidylinositide phosphatase SAC2 isoform X1 [Chironomus tepperi]|uniref:phosphatidylinositide phosphatase SAC2 isoform X1 n=1 Tax=Chironomus tepperi TaxID=113505 RepID=UPI00391F9778